MRTSQHSNVEGALFQWFKTVLGQNIPVSGPILVAKADSLANRLGNIDFKANQNWVERFKQRRGIVCRSINGESAVVDGEVVDNYTNTTLPNLLKDYDPKDVFNMDETGLFLQTLTQSHTTAERRAMPRGKENHYGAYCEYGRNRGVTDVDFDTYTRVDCG